MNQFVTMLPRKSRLALACALKAVGIAGDDLGRAMTSRLGDLGGTLPRDYHARHPEGRCGIWSPVLR